MTRVPSNRGPDTTPTQTGPRHPKKTPQQQADASAKSLRDEAAKLRRQADIEQRRGNEQDYASLITQATKLETQAKNVKPKQPAAPTQTNSSSNSRSSASTTFPSVSIPNTPTAPAPSSGSSSGIQWGSGATNAAGNAVVGALFGMDTDLLNQQVGPTGYSSGIGGSHLPQSMRHGVQTIASLLSDFYKQSMPERQALGAQLEAAGYLDPISPKSKKKRTSEDIYDAYKVAVVNAARSGVGINQYLADEAQAQQANGSDAAGMNPATNPLDIQALGQSAAQKGLGQNLDPTQLARFQQSFTAQEAPSLNPDATVSAPGAAGWDQWAQTRVREFDPQKFDARKVLSGVDVLARMLNAGGNASAITGGA